MSIDPSERYTCVTCARYWPADEYAAAEDHQDRYRDHAVWDLQADQPLVGGPPSRVHPVLGLLLLLAMVAVLGAIVAFILQGVLL